MTGSLCYHFAADHPHLRVASGTRKNGVIEIREANKGIAVYGPYVPLPTGAYTATLRFSHATPCCGSAVVDVCAQTGSRTLARKVVQGDQISEDKRADVTFLCTEPLRDVEIRLVTEGGFIGDVEGLEIIGDLTDDFPKVELADLPDVPIDKSPSRGRSLYDGYQRGVGLQFTDLPHRILRDPDFKEARELAGQRTMLGDLLLCNIFLIFKFYLPRVAFGHIVEFGSYMGGAAIFMAALARKFLPESTIFGFDTFSGMPPTDRRVDHHQAGAFAGVDLAELRAYVAEIKLQNLKFVQGDFADTAVPTLQQMGSVSFCHIDCDIRSAIECAYDATKPFMVAGGYWIFDDPMTSDCLGAAEAMEDLVIRRDGLNSEQVFPHYVFRQR